MVTVLGPSSARAGGVRSSGAPLVDLDRASAAEIERLPYVGPALARRIVADRDSLGAFGGTAALGEVRGVGPALLERLKDRVTFSAPPRPPRAASPARRRARR
jgi:competence protein ComEA